MKRALRNSICLSSDVNAAYDPTFPNVYEERNSCYLNKGCVLTKYTGSRGKSSSNDASAEVMAKVIAMMDQEGVYWQIGELGAVDVGGGGTIDMSRISAFALTSYGVEKSVLLSIPYTFVNRDHFWNFANSDLAPEFLMEPHDNNLGVRGLFYGEEGFRHFFTVKEISQILDMNENTIRSKLRRSRDRLRKTIVQSL